MTPVGRGRAAGTTGLVVAAVVAAVLLAGAAVLRISVETAGAPLPDRLVPVMFGAALLLVGLLALPRLPGLAWAFVALAAPIGTLEIVAVVRSLETVASGTAWRDLALIAGLALGGAVLVDGAYAGRNLARASNQARLASARRGHRRARIDCGSSVGDPRRRPASPAGDRWRAHAAANRNPTRPRDDGWGVRGWCRANDRPGGDSGCGAIETRAG